MLRWSNLSTITNKKKSEEERMRFSGGAWATRPMMCAPQVPVLQQMTSSTMRSWVSAGMVSIFCRNL